MRRLTTLQLLIALEEAGVVDMFVSDDSIIIITNHGGDLNWPDWLRQEYELHRDDLRRQLRRVKRVTLGVFAVGVCK